MSYLQSVLSYAGAFLSNPFGIFMTFAGTFMGLVFGSLPGLTATMGIALLIPLTFTMDSVSAFGMMLGCYVGGMAGGAVASVLLNIPGTPSAIVTTFDGYPMAQKGRGAEALGWAALASTVGSFISWIVLIFLAPTLARICTSFSMPEYTALAFLGLTIIASMSGKNIFKGLMAGCLGLMLSMVGVDPVWGNLRFTFGNVNLIAGISTMPALLGFYSIPQVIAMCQQRVGNKEVNAKLGKVMPPAKEIWKNKVNLLRSSIIGTLIGIIPATGGSTAAFLAYDQAKRFSKEPDSFGKGNPNGIIASEAANNGVVGGALVPMLTLGIPGDPVTAVLMGGLLIHGLQPGATLFSEHLDIVVGIFTAVLLATIFMFLIQIFGIRLFVKVLKVQPYYLAGILVALSLIGSYALRGSMFDVGITLVLGILGYLMTQAGFPLSPAVLGLVLGGMFERELRLTLKTYNNSVSVFFTRPVSCIIILVALAFIIHSVYKTVKANKAYAADGTLEDEPQEEVL